MVKFLTGNKFLQQGCPQQLPCPLNSGEKPELAQMNSPRPLGEGQGVRANNPFCQATRCQATHSKQNFPLQPQLCQENRQSPPPPSNFAPRTSTNWNLRHWHWPQRHHLRRQNSQPAPLRGLHPRTLQSRVRVTRHQPLGYLHPPQFGILQKSRPSMGRIKAIFTYDFTPADPGARAKRTSAPVGKAANRQSRTGELAAGQAQPVPHRRCAQGSHWAVFDGITCTRTLRSNPSFWLNIPFR